MSGTAPWPQPPPPESVRADVVRALAEDIGSGDVTAALIDPGAHARARIICREDSVLAGSPWADECFRQLDPGVRMHWHRADGDRVLADIRALEGTIRARLLYEYKA